MIEGLGVALRYSYKGIKKYHGNEEEDTKRRRGCNARKEERGLKREVKE